MAAHTQVDEKDLLFKLQRGDAQAFNSLYLVYSKRIAGYFFKLFKTDELVQDAMQDLFTKVWELHASINPEQSFGAFLFKMATNQALDTFRKIKRDENMKAVLAMQSTVFYTNIEENLISVERKKLLNDALNQLPAKQREVLILHKLEGKSCKEIADQLNVSVSAINNHVYRAMLQLGKILKSPITILIALTSLFFISCATF